jgi:CheY-like chemotaxis protein
VDAVDSGVAAVMAARENKPDLILMDLQLRDVAGREAIN